MWTWLGTMPIWAQFSLPIVALFIILLISIYGNAVFSWGKKTRLGFGKNSSGKKERSCKDCVLLILSKKAQHSSIVEKKEASILRDQMNFVEQKMQEVLFGFIDSYNQQQKEVGDVDPIRKNKEITLYSEALKNALFQVKDEVRRSFKENGFHELKDSDFREYVKDKTRAIISIAKNYFINRYPHQGMQIGLSERFVKLDEARIEDLTNEVFIKAKEIRNDIDEQIKKLNESFANDMGKFMGEEDT
jgi:hypothetical protein